jgi:hypothetical protein
MRVSINGREKAFEVSDNDSFGDFLKHVRTAYTSSSSCISSIRIDGIELTTGDGGEFAILPISEIRELEIFTTHPRELADETLQNLRKFSDQLEALCFETAKQLTSGENASIGFARLVDGLQMFIDGIEGVKRLLGLPKTGIAPVLEADLLSILKDLLDYYRLGKKDYVAELLSEHLTGNLVDWRTKAIPALIRSRDS